MPPVWFSFIAPELLCKSYMITTSLHALHYISGFFIIMSPAEGLHFSALVTIIIAKDGEVDKEGCSWYKGKRFTCCVNNFTLSSWHLSSYLFSYLISFIVVLVIVVLHLSSWHLSSWIIIIVGR